MRFVVVIVCLYDEILKRLFLQILGYGCHGTVVRAGSFGGRRVAVKRMLREYCVAAQREVRILAYHAGAFA